MISKECFTNEWINKVSADLKYNDKNLIEKVVRALSLLEMLVAAGCPLVFKGGTALMLILSGKLHRLSIDIDIICPPGTDIEQYLAKFEEYGFSSKELVERKQRDTNIPKSHSKLFYQIAYCNSDKPSYILLDVLYEDVHYEQTNEVDIASPFLKLEGKPLKVRVPSAEDILGDKLTAFAPNTTGIPYYKNENSCSMEICKQMYDISRLFGVVDDLSITARAFQKIAALELQYRKLADDVSVIYEDIRNTALCICLQGKVDPEHFVLLQDGIKRIKSFMYQGRYVLDDAIRDAARAAYIATAIEKGVYQIEKYSGNPLDVAQLKIEDTLPNKLNKLKSNNPEAFYYWAKTSELLKH